MGVHQVNSKVVLAEVAPRAGRCSPGAARCSPTPAHVALLPRRTAAPAAARTAAASPRRSAADAGRGRADDGRPGQRHRPLRLPRPLRHDHRARRLASRCRWRPTGSLAHDAAHAVDGGVPRPAGRAARGGPRRRHRPGPVHHPAARRRLRRRALPRRHHRAAGRRRRARSSSTRRPTSPTSGNLASTSRPRLSAGATPSGRGSGEAVQLKVSGEGTVYVQASRGEDLMVTTAAARWTRRPCPTTTTSPATLRLLRAARPGQLFMQTGRMIAYYPAPGGPGIRFEPLTAATSTRLGRQRFSAPLYTPRLGGRQRRRAT